jgi:hypothetical protein
MWAWRLAGLEFGREVNEDCWRILKLEEFWKLFVDLWRGKVEFL